MEADLTLEELSSTIKSKAMKDTGPGQDGIPYSVYKESSSIANCSGAN